MPSRRDLIRMSDEEQRAFLDGARTMILCSIGPGGVPHPMPMWFALEADGSVVMSTFRKSQKLRNLERDPRVSLLVEDGETYPELRGVVIYGKAQLDADTDHVVEVLARVAARSGPADLDEASLRQGLRSTAEKRTLIRVRPERVVSWDHRKLGGRY